MVPNVLKPTTITLLKKYRPTRALVHARAQFSTRSSEGSVHGLLKISAVFLNDARNVQRIGGITTNAHSTSATWPSRENNRRSRPVDSGTLRWPPPGSAGPRGGIIDGWVLMVMTGPN